MLLTIDIGNTNITLGLFKGNDLIRTYRISTKEKKYSSLLKMIFSNNRIDDAIVCSVVPKSTLRLKRDLKKFLKNKPIILGENRKVPIKNLYQKPSQVGQDRLVNAFAAIKMFGSPSIIIDYGTAITFDVVSRNKEYLGGMILPGIEISLDALAQKTALLPKIKLEFPDKLIGKNTKASMLSGIVFGFAALTDDLITRIKKEISKKAIVIGTGGNINSISKYCRKIEHIDINLTLKGLNLIYNSIK